MKLLYKINLVGLIVLATVGLAITVAGVSTIKKVSYELNRELMLSEVNNVVSMAQAAHQILVENRLNNVQSYEDQAQHDVIKELTMHQYGRTGRLMIINGRGQVVKHATLTVGSPIDIQQVPEMIQQGLGTMEFDYNGSKRFFTYKVFSHWDWLVVLSVASEEMLVARNRFMGQVVVILLISLMIGAVIFIWFIRRVVGPIRQLADATTYVSEGKWDVFLPEPEGSDEVAQLTTAFRKMAKRLALMYGSLEKNIKEIEASRNALQESEEKYRGLVQLLPLTVYEADADGRIVFANKNAFETFGLTKSDMPEDLFLENLVIPEEKNKVRDDILRVLDGEVLGMLEYTGLRRDKTSFPGIALTTPIYYMEKPVGIRGIFIDITQRKSLENELRQAREFLNTILNTVADPVFVKNDQHQFILVNNAFCDYMGHTRENILDKTEYDFFLSEEADRFREKDEQAFSDSQPVEIEETVTHTDGKQRVVLTKKAVFKDSDSKRFLVGIIKDITQRKKMEKELFKSQKLESIGVLAGGIAHDFNNILTAVIGNLSLAIMHVEENGAAYERIKASEKASFRARDLTQQLLTFSRGGAPVKHTVSLAGLIEESVTFTLRGAKVNSEFDIAPNLWPVDVDEGQISRVIHNIVLNASQALVGSGTVYVKASNLILTKEYSTPSLMPGHYICLEVNDNGIGIPDEILSDIFDPYFTTKEMGNGLGLATAFSVIKRHGGYIGVESSSAEGTTFKIYLPASEKQMAASIDKDTQELKQGQGRILLMDDEEELLDVTEGMLDILGYTHARAKDGLQALEKYKQEKDAGNPFDLVIMDLTIPGGMGGQTAIRKLLDIDQDAKVIVSSGYSKDPVMAEYKTYGFAGMIEKPFELKKLGQTLHDVLALDRSIQIKEDLMP